MPGGSQTREASVSEPLPYARRQPPAGGANVLVTFVSAGIFLYFGFPGSVGISDSAVYNHAVTAFVWSARIIGVGLAVVGLMLLLRLPGTALLDLGLAAVATAVCFVIGGIWIVYGGGDANGFLLLIFGLVNASATRAAWMEWRARHRAPAAPPESTE
jgi:hypothetical protein